MTSTQLDNALQTAETLKVMTQYHLAWKRRDIIEIMAMFHKDIEYNDFFINRTMGLKEIPAYIQACLPKRPGEMLTHTDRLRADGHTAFIQYRLVMQGASYRCSEAITIKDGLIFQINEYGVLIRDDEQQSQPNGHSQDRSAISRLGLSARELANLSQDLKKIENSQTSQNLPNIDQLAYEAGFNSLSAFYKHFRRITGLSPKAYVKQHLGHAPKA